MASEVTPMTVTHERCSKCGFYPIACRCSTTTTLYRPCSYVDSVNGIGCNTQVPAYRSFCYTHATKLELETNGKDRRKKISPLPGTFHGRLRGDAEWHKYECECWLCDPPAPVLVVVPPSYDKKEYFNSEEVLSDTESEEDGVHDYTKTWISIANRRRMKTGMALETIHFRLSTGGERDAIDTFHYILKNIDNDYPLDPYRKMNEKLDFCKKCHGLVWQKATLQPEQIKRLGRQCKIRLKISRFVEERKCGNTQYVAQEVGASVQ